MATGYIENQYNNAKTRVGTFVREKIVAKLPAPVTNMIYGAKNEFQRASELGIYSPSRISGGGNLSEAGAHDKFINFASDRTDALTAEVNTLMEAMDKAGSNASAGDVAKFQHLSQLLNFWRDALSNAIKAKMQPLNTMAQNLRG